MKERTLRTSFALDNANFLVERRAVLQMRACLLRHWRPADSKLQVKSIQCILFAYFQTHTTRFQTTMINFSFILIQKEAQKIIRILRHQNTWRLTLKLGIFKVHICRSNQLLTLTSRSRMSLASFFFVLSSVPPNCLIISPSLSDNRSPLCTTNIKTYGYWMEWQQ